MKLFYMQFNVADWLNDPDLRRCTHQARGVWIDLLCIMFRCEYRGVLATSGKPWSHDDVAQAVGGNADVARSCIRELLAKGVASLDESGAIISRRMVRDEQIRRQTSTRVQKHRNKDSCNGDSNGDVTPLKHTELESELNLSPLGPPASGEGGERKRNRPKKQERAAERERLALAAAGFLPDI